MDLFSFPPIAATLDAAYGAVFGAVVVVLVLVAELSRRAFRPSTVDATGSEATLLRISGPLHYVTAVIALFLPLAAGLYLVVTVTWTLVQRIVLRRHFPLHAP